MPADFFFLKTKNKNRYSNMRLLNLILKITGLMTFFIFMISELNCNAQDIVKIKRLNSPIEFDGIPDEISWMSADMFPLKMHKPVFDAD